MKVIELLQKIANGEKVPKKIKWGCHNLEWFVYEYKAIDEVGSPNLNEITTSFTETALNDEIEIIEEDKPTKMSIVFIISELEKIEEHLRDVEEHITANVVSSACAELKKFNEIIDKLNKGDKE